MRFGKIDYLNLAPFDVFVKKYPAPSQFKLFLKHHKSYPARLNREFLFRRIDAGFISSIAGVAARKTKSAIIAKGEVWSVIAIKSADKTDYQSASSNALAKVLGVKGEVLIGDRALRHRLSHSSETYQDLGLLWWQKHRLPFVFGLLCYGKNASFYTRLSRAFNRRRTKIPQYLLRGYAKDSGISRGDITRYLKHIHYRLDDKARAGLVRFYRLARLSGAKIPSRF